MNSFSLLIINWYRQNYRKLPWRESNNPYEIWLSEIILQQTRVNQGLPFYQRFITTFPTVFDLAKADEQEVLKLWQGLGYYSRARNLHFAAQQIVNDFNGVFPSTYNEIKSLKGVGDYTAAAIASFAFGLSYPAIDGNVLRVLSRFYEEDTPIDTAQGKKLFKKYANNLIDSKQPALFNQAMMEMGAIVCKPKQPDCAHCPLEAICSSHRNNTQGLLPKKSKKIKVKERYFHYLIFPNKHFQLIKREGNDIWKNMFQFPLVEESDLISFELLNLKVKEQWQTELKEEIFTVKHKLTHQLITATFWLVSAPAKNERLEKITIEDLVYFPIPKLIERFINTYPNLFS